MMGMQPSIILLKEGTDTSQGKAQLISNINACAAVADIVRTTLGPRGMDKLIHNNGKVMQPQPIIACLQVFSFEWSSPIANQHDSRLVLLTLDHIL